jgi:CheY-like chemotaxis protein
MQGKILLVEDDEMNRDMLSRRLVLQGHQVVLAGDGLQALALARQEMPDLILMDMNLPDLTGWEATRRLKDGEATRHIPVMALTAYAMSADRSSALEMGCDDYESKPVNWPRLVAKIDALLALGARR